MRFVGLLVVLSSFAVTYAAADSFPTYNLTSGTVNVFVSQVQTEELFSFSGPGASLVGASANADLCFLGGTGGSMCDPSMLLVNVGLPLPMTASLNGGPALLLLGGGIQMLGSPFLLPNNPSLATFSITLPISFSGTFTGCVTVDPVFFGCLDPNTGQINPPIAGFNVSGHGTATLTFTNIFPGSAPAWALSSGTYTLAPVPEPASLLLFGTGAVGLWAKYKRRKR